MKVAHLTTADISLWYLLLPQLKAVARIGGIAIGISAGGERVDDLESEGIRHTALRHSTRDRDLVADIKVLGELFSVLRRMRPDVLHTHNPKPGIYGRIIGRLAGVPVVLNTVHGLYASPEDTARKKVIVYTLEAIASRFSDYELVQSAEDYDLLARWRITRRSRTILLGNGIDVERFDPERFDAAKRAAIRRELSITPDAFVTGIVARLVRGKGFIELTAAAELLDAGHVIIAIGPNDPNKHDSLSAQEMARAEAAGIRFLGHRDDVDRLYAAMDAFVLPSHREGFPRAAMEAAAMGLPVVASNIRGCRQAVEDRATGILVPPHNHERIVDSLRLLAGDARLRETMGEAARRKALLEFDERSVVDTVLKLQVAALRQKGRFPHITTSSGSGLSMRSATARDVSILGAIRASGSGRGASSRRPGAWSRRKEAWRVRRHLKDIVIVEDDYGPVGYLRTQRAHSTAPTDRGAATSVQESDVDIAEFHIADPSTETSLGEIQRRYEASSLMGRNA